MHSLEEEDFSEQSENSSHSPTFSQVFIKSETGSTCSLLSIDSPLLQKNSPKQFVIRKAIEQNIQDNLIDNAIQNKDIKTEPIDEIHLSDDIQENNSPSDHDQGYECQNGDQNDMDIEDDIEAKKRLIIENETTVYRCQQCGGVFRKYAEYKMHRTEHSIEKRTCKICHILFQGTAKLNEHMNMHKGIKPFKCSLCKKSFISAHTLKCHMECHNTKISFKCEKCGKGFRTKRSLRGHMDTHAKKIKDYVCKICKEEFDFPTEYRRHLTEHGAQPPQPKCTVCGKEFKYESQLKIHLGTHKELKFPCEYCNKIFATMTKIRKHVKRTHVINECQLCKKVFYDKAEFARHKRTEHVEDFQESTFTIRLGTYDVFRIHLNKKNQAFASFAIRPTIKSKIFRSTSGCNIQKTD